MIDIVSLILHLDQYVGAIVKDYGIWVYLIIFLIIFLETGIVVMPFLPGDSLIFILGALAAAGALNIVWLLVLLAAAAIIGDTVNYWIGHHFNRKVLKTGKIKFVKKEHLDNAYDFYEKHGGKTIIIARFLPFARTFAPFVAGITHMKYSRFISYNIIGGIAWTAGFLLAGYYLGSVTIIKDNIGLLVIAIALSTTAIAFVGFLGRMVKKQLG